MVDVWRKGSVPRKDSDLLLYSGEQLGVSLVRVLGILGDGNLCFVGLHFCVS